VSEVHPLNIPPKDIIAVAEKSTNSKLLQPWKALSPILVREAGSIMDVNAAQLWNASNPNDCIEVDDKLILGRLVQPLNV